MPFRAPIWVPFWVHVWFIFRFENQNGFCTPPGSHFGDNFGFILVLFSAEMFFTCFYCPFEALLKPGMAIKHVKTQGFCMVLRCPKRSEKTPENVQNWFKKRPKYDPKMMSKLASKNGSKMAPKWLQKWSQNGSENDLENDLKKDTKKELFHKSATARSGSDPDPSLSPRTPLSLLKAQRRNV